MGSVSRMWDQREMVRSRKTLLGGAGPCIGAFEQISWMGTGLRCTASSQEAPNRHSFPLPVGTRRVASYGVCCPFGRPERGTLRKLARLNSLQELYELFGHLVPEQALAPTEAEENSRKRIFTSQVTFWAFAAQVLNPGSACREVVQRVEAW
jgi:hypothetical protein